MAPAEARVTVDILQLVLENQKADEQLVSRLCDRMEEPRRIPVSWQLLAALAGNREQGAAILGALKGSTLCTMRTKTPISEGEWQNIVEIGIRERKRRIHEEA